MRHSRSRIDRLFHRFRHPPWLRRLHPVPISPRGQKSPLASRFDDLLSRTRQEAAATQERASHTAARMQEVIDHADAMRPLVAYLPHSEIETLATLWDQLRGQIAFVRSSLEEATADSDLVSGTVSLTSASTVAIISSNVGLLNEDDAFKDAWTNYVTVTSRPNLIDEVRTLMTLFGLDTAPPGEKSALDLFDIAHDAFSSPVSPSNPASTSLIPMRESIQAALTHLLRRRPFQEPTGSSEREKLKSIGRQLRRQNVRDELVDAWAEEWHRLNDKALSGSKRAQLTRDEWRLRLTSATRFLHSLLTQLDPTKLRT